MSGAGRCPVPFLYLGGIMMYLLHDQTRDHEAGHDPNAVYQADPWVALDRFLILGTEGGSYYASEHDLTRQAVTNVQTCLRLDGVRTVQRIRQISQAGRAPKNDPALYALALAMSDQSVVTRSAAAAALPDVVRTGTHLFAFLAYAKTMRGWGPMLRRAIADWYTRKPSNDLAYQMIKYRQRHGYTHADALRLAHPTPPSEEHNRLFALATGKPTNQQVARPDMMTGYMQLATHELTPHEAARVILAYGLPWEAVPSDLLKYPEVWEALLPSMPINAMIRNLATMTRLGVLAPMTDTTAHVVARLTDQAKLNAARIHPLQVLTALQTYKLGRGARGQHTWMPVGQIVDALDAAFYLAFENAPRTGKRFMLALDISGSMAFDTIGGLAGVTPRDASAAMALVTMAREYPVHVVGFSHDLIPLDISPRQRLDDVIQKISGLTFGSTDCSAPMLYALDNNIAVDVFVVYTDSETNSHRMPPAQALRLYREQMGINAKLVVVGMVANEISIADPNDADMLDIVGFDAAAPGLIADFASGVFELPLTRPVQ